MRVVRDGQGGHQRLREGGEHRVQQRLLQALVHFTYAMDKYDLLHTKHLYSVLRIRIRMDPKLLPGSESGIIDPDQAKNKRA